MTYDELLSICDNYSFKDSAEPVKALRAVVELHKPFDKYKNGSVIVCECDPYDEYDMGYPCDTIQSIQEQLK